MTKLPGVVAVKQEKAELDRRVSIEKFDKDQLKKTNTVEKNSLPGSQGKKLTVMLSLALIKIIIIIKPTSLTIVNELAELNSY